MDFNIQIEISQQSMLDDFQMEFSHTTDQCLSGFLIFNGQERWILTFEHFERFRQFFPFICRFRFNRHRNDSFRKTNALQQNRLFGIANRVASD